MTAILGRRDLESWLTGIMQKRTLVAPRQVGELVLFQPVENLEDIVLDCQNTALSPKEYFFPKTETLFSVDRNNGDVELVPASVDKETVIFGIRPCDAKGLALLDYPFMDDPADALWTQHRSKTALIGLACAKPAPQCFCTSMGSAPNDSSNVDIMLTEIEDGYAVQAVTDKGKKLLEGADLREAKVKIKAPEKPAAVATEGIAEVAKREFDNPYWDRLADRCIHCNVCSYVCPTCYCFDVRDRSRAGKIERVRTWESCQSKGFTRIAGGYDPRETKGSRLRQRFCHKLLYFPEQFGPVACTGCGRCVVSCPVNIDIREIISDLQRSGAKVGKASK